MDDGAKGLALDSPNSFSDTVRTIAVMEDNCDIANFVRRQLSALNYNVMLADGLAGCMELAEHGCRTFIPDISMGAGREEEGIDETLKSLKAFNRDIFCILLTHSREDRLRKAARDPGCYAFLNKSGRELTEDFDNILRALDAMWLSYATDLAFDAAHRPKADELARRLEELRPDLQTDPRKEPLLIRYRELTHKDFEAGLTNEEREELERVTKSLESIEAEEADETDLRNAAGLPGRLDAKLDRIAELLREWKEMKSQHGPL